MAGANQTRDPCQTSMREGVGRQIESNRCKAKERERERERERRGGVETFDLGDGRQTLELAPKTIKKEREREM
jgi:hypothetical protein